MIELDSVEQRFDGRRVLKGVSLFVDEGELVVLVGPSGCGKTTTLKLVNRLIEPTSGVVRVAGKNVLEQNPIELRRSIGYVFQRFGLFPHLSVHDNIAIVPRLLGWDDKAIAGRVRELSELVGLDDLRLLQRHPRSLSGGQQQRVGLARALAAGPRIMLMDEPFGALDPVTRDGLQVEYQRLHQRLGLTTLMVTHDMSEALLLANRVLVMEAGGVIRAGTPRELLRQPGPALVQELLRLPERQLERLHQLRFGGSDER